METQPIVIVNFMTFTIGIMVYFSGRLLTQRVGFLREYNIPEPVTGGILASLVTLALFLIFNIELSFEMDIRNTLLIYFFTAIGLNARFSDLLKGGKPLLILLVITLSYIVFQNLIGVTAAQLLGLPNAMGVLTGSASLLGGHGTVIAWAPEISANHGVPNALELGVASATLGLIIASLLGGPIAKFLMARHKIVGSSGEELTVGTSYKDEATEKLSHVNFMAVMLVVHMAIIFGYMLNEVVIEIGIRLPLFVTCLFVGILMSNTIPLMFKKIPWPAHTPALAMFSEFSLGLFIAMSLMGMQLWAVADLAGPLIILLGLQVLVATLFVVFIFFRIMGSDYQSVVLSAGFTGFVLGATPTAIANMSAVTKSHGAAPAAFIILPLVGAFFVDLTNAFVIQFFLG
ncbi:MAG: sodium/glutamate symporter [Gammaproteobacteria bacterium]|nr:sodium/glutamate symporter [Gammaproteobacteria bacterium]